MRSNQNYYVWILVWLSKTKIWWKYKALLYGYRQLHCSCENRWYLPNIGEDFEKRFETSNYEIDRLFPKGKNTK